MSLFVFAVFCPFLWACYLSASKISLWYCDCISAQCIQLAHQHCFIQKLFNLLFTEVTLDRFQIFFLTLNLSNEGDWAHFDIFLLISASVPFQLKNENISPWLYFHCNSNKYQFSLKSMKLFLCCLIELLDWVLFWERSNLIRIILFLCIFMFVLRGNIFQKCGDYTWVHSIMHVKNDIRLISFYFHFWYFMLIFHGRACWSLHLEILTHFI